MTQPQPLRVLLLADTTSAHTLKWASSLAEAGLDVVLVGLYAGMEPGIAALTEAGRIRCEPGEAGYDGSFLGRAFLRRVRRVRALVRTWQPDVVHAHYASSYGLLGALGSAGKPLMISAWGSDVYAFPRRGPLFRAVLRFSLSRAVQVFSTSEAMAVVVRGLTRRPVAVIPFGVDTAGLARPGRQVRREPDGSARPFTFGTVKGLAEIYGSDVLVEAFAAVAARTEEPVRLRLVGDGPARAALETRVAALGLQERVAFAGAVPHAAVAAELDRMDAFCALSREESFGVAIVEALAAGLPVVVSDAPGPQEIVGGTGAGFVVRREAVEEAAEAMGRLLAEEVWAGCAEAAAPAARRRYHWPDQVAAQIQAYRALAPG